MLKLLAGTVLFGLGLAASPVAAGTYDAFTSFNGVQGAGHFTYGSYVAGAGTFTQFTSTSGCASLISDAACLHDASLPGVFKTTTGAHTSGTVIVPGDRLILHPGQFDNSAYVMFTAVSANLYDLNAGFSVQDTAPSGVGITYFTIVGGVLNLEFAGNLGATAAGFSNFQSLTMAAGDAFGFIIDKGSEYYNDSTGVGFTVTSVPEPATWSLLIAGFALTGFAMRRRQVALTGRAAAR